MCYKIRITNDTFVPMETEIEDRFGRQRYIISRPDTLCMPALLTRCQGGSNDEDPCVEDSACPGGTCVQPDPVDLNVNAFKCYKMRRARTTPPFGKREVCNDGPNVGMPCVENSNCAVPGVCQMEVGDLFETKRLVARRPKLFCTPVGVGVPPPPGPTPGPVIPAAGAPYRTCYKIKDRREVPRQPAFTPKLFETIDEFADGDPLKAVRGAGLRVSFVCLPAHCADCGPLPSPSGAFLDVAPGLLD
jgi:hypothetical protein